MPALEKQLILDSLNKINKTTNDFKVFIETGTFLGETSQLASDIFSTVYTIEIYEELYNNAQNNFLNTNVHPILGDSTDMLPNLLSKVNENTVFWLDGHNSGPGTGVGSVDFPVLQECKIIDENFKGDLGLILIDDVRLFGVGHHNEIDDSLITLTVEKILDTFKEKTVINHWLEPSNLSENDRLIIFIK
jgi:hypothetical protein